MKMKNRLMLMTAISFFVMYILMYAMVDTFNNAIPNFNQLYMAILMTGAMIVIEIIVMSAMYGKNEKLIGIGFGIILLIGSFMFIRNQTFISDKQFLESMIPHHASALLMCENAKLTDPEIKQLCESIVSGQQEQIDWMKEKLSTL